MFCREKILFYCTLLLSISSWTLLVDAQEFGLRPLQHQVPVASPSSYNGGGGGGNGVTRQMYSSLASFTLATTTAPSTTQPPVFHFNASLFSSNSGGDAGQRSHHEQRHRPSSHDPYDENAIDIHQQQHHHQHHGDEYGRLPVTLAPSSSTFAWNANSERRWHSGGNVNHSTSHDQYQHHSTNRDAAGAAQPLTIDASSDSSLDALGALLGQPISWVWTRWTTFGPCSTQCGPGLQQQERFCVAQGQDRLLGQDDTLARCGGGQNVRHRACTRQPTCFGERDARQPLCAQQSNTTFAGNVRYQWEPTSLTAGVSSAACDLMCKPVNESFSIRFGTLPNGFECRVPTTTATHSSPLSLTYDESNGRAHAGSGTESLLGASGICVNGTCMDIGCDGIINSQARRNKCGICDALASNSAQQQHAANDAPDSSAASTTTTMHCTTTARLFDERNLPVGHNTIASIPASAASINITELGRSGNAFAIRSDSFGVILDGSKVRQADEGGFFAGAGTKFYYRRGDGGSSAQQILADGPLSENVDVILVTSEENPGISYEYSVLGSSPIDDVGQTVSISSSSSSGSGSAGAGSEQDAEREHYLHLLRHRQHIARQQSMKGVSRAARVPASPLLRDVGDTSAIALGGEARWILTEWSACSATCGMGTQTRQIKCQQMMANGELHDVPYELCGLNPSEREYVRSCQQLQPCHDWRVGAWTKCIPNCGAGHQRRLVKCINLQTGEFAENEALCQGRQPNTERDCQEEACKAYWYTSAWAPCNPVCPTPGIERSVQARKVVCMSSDNAVTGAEQQQLDESHCSALARPHHLRDCPTPPDPLLCEPQADWLIGPWSDCSTPPNQCGKGIRRRVVVCVKTYTPTNTKGYDPAQATVVDDSLCMLRTLSAATAATLSGDVMRSTTTAQQKPIEREPCGDDCPLSDDANGGVGEWFASEWGPCSLGCVPDEVFNDALQHNTPLPRGTQSRTALCLRTHPLSSSSSSTAVSSSLSSSISVRAVSEYACSRRGSVRPVVQKTCKDAPPRCPDRPVGLDDEFIDDEAYWNRPVQYEKGGTTRTLVPMSSSPQPIPTTSVSADTSASLYYADDGSGRQQHRYYRHGLYRRGQHQVQTPPPPTRHQPHHYQPHRRSPPTSVPSSVAPTVSNASIASTTDYLDDDNSVTVDYDSDNDYEMADFDFDEPYANFAGLTNEFLRDALMSTTSTTAAPTVLPATSTTSTQPHPHHHQRHSHHRRRNPEETSSTTTTTSTDTPCVDRQHRCQFIKDIGYCTYEHYRRVCCQTCAGED